MRIFLLYPDKGASGLFLSEVFSHLAEVFGQVADDFRQSLR